ncbi:hypothetical protein BH09ACT6_BH09ACT6_19200 [soil metagenome]
MRTDPPTGDELTSMLTTMKTNVLRQTNTSMTTPTPARRTHSRAIGITIAIVSLLVVGSAGAALALNGNALFNAPPAPSATVTPTPTPTPTPTVTPTKAPTESPEPSTTPSVVDLTNTSGWILSYDGIGPLSLGAPLSTASTAMAAFPQSPNPSCAVQLYITTGSLSFLVTPTSNSSTATIAGLSLTGSMPSDLISSPKTDAGIGIGSTAADVLAAYPTITAEGPGSHGETSYSQTDGTTWIGFQANSEGVVDYIYSADSKDITLPCQ